MREKKFHARQVALPAMLAALALVILYLAVLAPTGRIGLVALAGLLPAAAVISAGFPAGCACYAVTGLLALLLLPDKGCALLYLIFFGLYPLLKHLIERLRKLPLEWALKLAVFNLALTVFWFGLTTVLLANLPIDTLPVWGVYLLGNLVFVVYDIGFSKLAGFYSVRVDKAVRGGQSS